MRKQINRALWGQCIGDSIGRHLLNKTNAESIWKECVEQQSLPFKRGRYSVYAQQSLTFVQQHHSNVQIDIEHFQKSLITRLRSKTSNTMLCRAIRNGAPFDSADLETAVRLGPIATCFSDHNQMLDWLYPLSMIVSTNPIALTGAALYASACWHRGQESSANIFDSIATWQGITSLSREILWAYQQATYILSKEYDQQEMLSFVGSFLGQDVPYPTSQLSLSILPIMIHNTQTDFIHSLTEAIKIGGELELIGGMMGCLSALSNDIPDWLQAAYSRDHILNSKFPIQIFSSQNSDQFKLF